jgi:hypothetical protein
VFKRHSKNRVWYKNKNKCSPTSHKQSLLLAENKALKAQIDLLKAIGNSSVPSEDIIHPAAPSHESTGTIMVRGTSPSFAPSNCRDSECPNPINAQAAERP